MLMFRSLHRPEILSFFTERSSMRFQLTTNPAQQTSTSLDMQRKGVMYLLESRVPTAKSC